MAPCTEAFSPRIIAEAVPPDVESRVRLKNGTEAVVQMQQTTATAFLVVAMRRDGRNGAQKLISCLYQLVLMRWRWFSLPCFLCTMKKPTEEKPARFLFGHRSYVHEEAMRYCNAFGLVG
jgi:hypothetical protein